MTLGLRNGISCTLAAITGQSYGPRVSPYVHSLSVVALGAELETYLGIASQSFVYGTLFLSSLDDP